MPVVGIEQQVPRGGAFARPGQSDRSHCLRYGSRGERADHLRCVRQEHQPEQTAGSPGRPKRIFSGGSRECRRRSPPFETTTDLRSFSSLLHARSTRVPAAREQGLEEHSLAEDEAEAGYLQHTQQNEVSKEQDVKYKERKSTGSKKSAGELASDRDSVSAGLEYLAKLNDMCVAKAMTHEENPQRCAAKIAGLKKNFVHSESESHSLSESSSDMRYMRLSMRIARGGVSLILVVHCCASVVSSRVIIAHIMWMRRRLESQVIATNSHRLDSFLDRFVLATMMLCPSSLCTIQIMGKVDHRKVAQSRVTGSEAPRAFFCCIRLGKHDGFPGRHGLAGRTGKPSLSTGHTTRQADGFVECRMLTRLSWWKWLCFLWS